jgi:hypothetical protein
MPTLKRFYVVPFTPFMPVWDEVGTEKGRPSGPLFSWLLLLALLLDHPGLVPGVASMSEPATLRQIHSSSLTRSATCVRPVSARISRQGRAALFEKGQNVHDRQAAADIEAVASDFYDIEELLTERLHEIHKTYGLDSLRDIADRLKHSIDIDVEIAMGRC